MFEDYTDVYNNKIETYYLFNNVVGNNFFNNTIGDNFYDNTISLYFANNTIGFNFNTNIIGDGFIYNTIKDGFFSNTIGRDFVNNTIGNKFESNGSTLNPFVSNNTEFRNYINSVISSIEIQNPYIDVVVFKSPNGTLKQRYYDDSNNLVINNL